MKKNKIYFTSLFVLLFLCMMGGRSFAGGIFNGLIGQPSSMAGSALLESLSSVILSIKERDIGDIKKANNIMVKANSDLEKSIKLLKIMKEGSFSTTRLKVSPDMRARLNSVGIIKVPETQSELWTMAFYEAKKFQGLLQQIRWEGNPEEWEKVTEIIAGMNRILIVGNSVAGIGHSLKQR